MTISSYMTTVISEDLLSALVCPATGCCLEYDEQSNVLISKAANLEYSIKDHVPILIPELAKSHY